MPYETAADRACFFAAADGACSAIHIPAPGNRVACTVRVHKGIEQLAGDIEVIAGTHTILVRVSEVAAPAHDTTFEVTDAESGTVTTYRVERVLKDDGGIASVACSEV